MAERYPVRHLQYRKAIRDVHFFFQEEGLKIKNNQPLLPYIMLFKHLCAALKISQKYGWKNA
jgi:hypothetical protein